MARPILLSNGSLHVGINNYGLVHDLYFPHVGLENHSAGKDLRHKVGVWVDGRISWLDDGAWEFRFRTSTEALIGHTRAKHVGLGVILEFDDFVDAEQNIFFRNIHIVNLSDQSREIRVFLHQAFVIGDSRSNTDTAQYLPDNDAILHYRGRRAFVIGGSDSEGKTFDQRSIGLFGIEGREGTWRDAEDGELSNGDVEHGRVDSTIRFVCNMSSHSSTRLHYWLTAGSSIRDALKLHRKIGRGEHSLDTRQQATLTWWKNWLRPTLKVAERLPAQDRELFIKSAMVIRAHIDKDGAIIASTDTAMLNYSRDAYGYCWPRDGAFALWPLIRLGYTEEPMKFFSMMRDALHSKGYLMHKYRADGALGSSWHPYMHTGGLTTPPIQEDETAIVLFLYAQFRGTKPDAAHLDEFFPTFVKPMAEFLAMFVDESTGLPRPSYDLWEEKFLTTTYTTAITYAALVAAAELAEIMTDQDSAVKWRTVAGDIAEAAKKHLFDEETNCFKKGILPNGQGDDNTVDASSLYGSFMFGLFGAKDDFLVRSFETVTSRLRTPGRDRGLQRYENDQYRRSSGASGNPWMICTLWEAQYYLETNQTDKARAIIDWVHTLESSTGMLAEQIDPETEAPVSVQPLVWSHAEYMATALDSLLEGHP